MRINDSSVSEYPYELLFSRNFGVFSERDQERICEARVMIVGVGGMGGTVAIILARTGFSHFFLIDPDVIEPTNMNRQIGCFTDTIGKPKVEVVKQEILGINSRAQVEVLQKTLTLDEVKQLILHWRPAIVVAETGDVAYSAKVVRIASQLGVYAITGMPSGFCGYVMAFPPHSKYTPEALFGLPENLSYEELRNLIECWENRCGRRWYITRGKWRVSWWKEWREGKKSITQIAPNLWLTASITASEIVKYIIGKGKLIIAPYMWYIVPADGKIEVRKYAEGRLFNKYALKAFSIKFLDIGNKWRYLATIILSFKLNIWERGQKRLEMSANRCYQKKIKENLF